MINKYPTPPVHIHRKFCLVLKYKITKRGCWEFINVKAHTPAGYPLYRRQGKNYFYSHFSLEHFKNIKFKKGDYACHSCDNPGCINPDHLYKGNEKTNKIDMVNRCRSTKGEKNPGSKLTESEVREIRKLLINKKMSQKEIAEKYGIRQGSISRINTKKEWGWLV